MNNLITFLRYRLQQDLPGKGAQLQMAPKPVSEGPNRPMSPDSSASPSTVLILLLPNDEMKWELVLTLRSDNIDHGGQLSFPGGRAEPNETPAATALREANEEIGIATQEVTIIGELSPLYISHSNSQVTPVVGYMDSIPDFIANPDEVEEIFSVELKSLATKKNLIEEQWKLQDHHYHVPYWDVHRVPLWGATAMMLNEFLDLYREFVAKEP
ncbi:NUDIX hydrolase [Fodinibius salsisoli]|uniref:CoA pyrophosphatase n=1 Tax=Fodinibius salsisoli TaxID=2820877 RepID=A0ABT3PP25_9BACT|nr:CoA pyrophosphatase [Fodinibius salsisoli]MCW9707599.1 CoA pyrophosphatase [Fodinibius salsisoli]